MNINPEISPSENPCRVLVVEDEAIVAIDIQQQLESLGYDVVATASTAKEACEAAARLLPQPSRWRCRWSDASSTGSARDW